MKIKHIVSTLASTQSMGLFTAQLYSTHFFVFVQGVVQYLVPVTMFLYDIKARR